VIAEELDAQGADPSLLTLEVTETALIKDIDAAQRFAVQAAGLGCRLALDDFGAGFGGFTYLKRLAIDQLKIDREFVRDLTTSHASQHVVKAVISLAEAFGLETVAEGIEDEETFALLDHYGVDRVQGYFLGKPGPVEGILTA
jgi:EAL domain-containing protein (putative c-di-GMP-specific phosphodiesterase class I)